MTDSSYPTPPPPQGPPPSYSPPPQPGPPPYGPPQPAVSPYGPTPPPYAATFAPGPAQASFGQPVGYPGVPAPGQPVEAEKGFVGKLFDLSFTTFVTPSIAKVVYVLVIIVAAVIWLGVIIAGFRIGAGSGLVAVLFGWIPALLMIIMYRMFIEFIIAGIRTAENTSRIP